MRKIQFILAYFCIGLILHFPLMVFAENQQVERSQGHQKINLRVAMQVSSLIVNAAPSVEVFLNVIEKSVAASSMKTIRNYFAQSGIDLKKPFDKTKFLEDGSIQIGASADQVRLSPNLTIEIGSQKKIWQPQSPNDLEKNLKSLSDFFKKESTGAIKSKAVIWLLGQEAQANERSQAMSYVGNSVAISGALLLVLSLVTEGALAIGLAVGGWAVLGVGTLFLLAALIESYGVQILPDLRDGKAKVTFEGGWPVVSRGNIKVESKLSGVSAQVKQALTQVMSSLKPQQLEEAAKGLPGILNQKTNSDGISPAVPAALPTAR